MADSLGAAAPAGPFSSPRRRRNMAVAPPSSPSDKSMDGGDTMQDLEGTLPHPMLGYKPAIRTATPPNEANVAASTGTDAYPPSFAESQFMTIITRQVSRPKAGGGIKKHRTTRFPNLPDTFEFSGWGVTEYIELAEAEIEASAKKIKGRDGKVMGTLVACGLAGNDVFGSVFYAFPAVVGVAGVYSPIALFIATLLIFVYRPVMVELGSAIPISGANYMYALHVGSKNFALLAATLTLLDTLSTGIVSAATAGAYLSGEIASLPFATLFLTFFILLAFAFVALCGLKESARVAFAILSIHVATLIALVLASVILWAKSGNDILRANWQAGHNDATKSIPRALFDGVCLAILGLTGIETVPNTLSAIKPGRYPKVLRNLHYGAILLNGPLMLIVMAVLPIDIVTSGANVLSAVALAAGGKPLRIVIVVDAVLVLCAGVLTGITGATALLERMSRDRVLPRSFLMALPLSGAPWLSIGSFVVIGSLIYACSGFSLSVCSQIFSVTYLLVLGFFGVSLLFMKISRPHLPRTPQCSLLVVVLAIAVTVIAVAGNIALAPPSFGYFVAYFVGVFAMLWACKEVVTLLKWGCWVTDRLDWLRRGRLEELGTWMVRTVKRLRRPAVCCLVKNDEIDQLFRMMLHISNNESTSNVKLIHFYDDIDSIPSELEANSTIVDEAFPAITVDLLFVQAQFSPASVDALSAKLGIDRTMFLMTCPTGRLPFSIEDLGTRIITV